MKTPSRFTIEYLKELDIGLDDLNRVRDFGGAIQNTQAGWDAYIEVYPNVWYTPVWLVVRLKYEGLAIPPDFVWQIARLAFREAALFGNGFFLDYAKDLDYHNAKQAIALAREYRWRWNADFRHLAFITDLAYQSVGDNPQYDSLYASYASCMAFEVAHLAATLHESWHADGRRAERFAEVRQEILAMAMEVLLVNDKKIKELTPTQEEVLAVLAAGGHIIESFKFGNGQSYFAHPTLVTDMNERRKIRPETLDAIRGELDDGDKFTFSNEVRWVWQKKGVSQVS